MNKIVLLAILLLGASTSFAKGNHYDYKHWKTWRSDWGYEFKYPSCWVLRVNNSDEPQTVTPKSKELSVMETNRCARPQMAKYVPNGIYISGGADPLKSVAAGQKQIKSILVHAKNNVIRNVWKTYKHIKINGNDELFWVGVDHDVNYREYRWKVNLYCPTQMISFSGPYIGNPSKTYDNKFKAGDLGIPEPEKTIYASIKCIPSKKLKTPK